MPSAPKLEAPQGQPLFDVQFRAISESLAGNGVLTNSDLEVTDGTNALEIDVASGTLYYVATEYTYAGASPAATLSGGDATYDRWDTIAFDTGTSSVVVHEGTPAQYPEPPDISGGEVLLAIVYVASGATDIGSGDILNWRAKFSNESEEVHYDDSTGVYGVDNVDAALDELQEAAQITAYPLDIATDTEASQYPLANFDLANSTITVNAGNALSTTNAGIGLGGSATIDIVTDGIQTDELDLSITPTWTGAHTFDAAQVWQEVTTPSTPGAGYNRAYFKSDDFLHVLASDGTERRVGTHLVTASVSANYTTAGEDAIFVDPSGTGGVTITLASADVQDGFGTMIMDAGQSAGANPITIATEGTETIDGGSSKVIDNDSSQLRLETDGTNWYSAGGAASVGVDTSHFDKDETGTVNTGNVGLTWFTNVPDGKTIKILQAGLLLDTLEPAPSGLDLIIYTGDNAGGATKRATVLSGDGATVYDDQTGDPLASWTNSTGGALTTAVGVDNGNFNTGSGANQDIGVSYMGLVE